MGRRTNQIADLRPGKSCHTVNRRGDSRESEVETSIFHRSLSGNDSGQSRLLSADSIVEVLFTHCILGGKGFDPIKIGLGIRMLCLLSGEFSLCLVKGCLKGTRIDFKQELTCFNNIAFFIILPDQVARDLSPDGGIDKPVGGTDPLVDDRYIFLNNLHDFHFLNPRRMRIFLAAGGKINKRETGKQGQCPARCNDRIKTESKYRWPHDQLPLPPYTYGKYVAAYSILTARQFMDSD